MCPELSIDYFLEGQVLMPSRFGLGGEKKKKQLELDSSIGTPLL